MKVYVCHSNSKFAEKLFLPYSTAISQYLDVVDNIYDADVVLLLGAWIRQLSLVASKARHIGMPYILVPLGDLSAWSCKHPHVLRFSQRHFYLSKTVRKAACLIATTPMEKEYLVGLAWNDDVRMVRYPVYTRMTDYQLMTDGIRIINESVLQDFEDRREKQIADMTDNLICRQLLLIYRRMSHRNIPFSYIASLHAMLLADNYDEDLLAVEMKRLHITTFAASLFHAMHDVTGLTEGFMPIPDKKSKLSKRIIKYLRNQPSSTATE